MEQKITLSGQRMIDFLEKLGRPATNAEIAGDFAAGLRAVSTVARTLLRAGIITRPIRGSDEPFKPGVTPADSGKPGDIDCSRWMLVPRCAFCKKFATCHGFQGTMNGGDPETIGYCCDEHCEHDPANERCHPIGEQCFCSEETATG